MPFITIKESEESNIDYNRYEPVVVMAYWSMEGKITPMRLKYVNADESIETIKIDKIKYIKDLKDGFSYCCLAMVYGHYREFILVFRIREHLWLLEKS